MLKPLTFLACAGLLACSEGAARSGPAGDRGEGGNQSSLGGAVASSGAAPSGGGGFPQAGATAPSGGTSASAGSAGSNSASAGNAGQAASNLSDRHPSDQGLGDEPAVLFFDDFEGGWGKWDSPEADTAHLHLENGALANAGSHYLRSTVTRLDLEQTQYISSAARVAFAQRQDRLFWRFHVRFPVLAPNPHHWVRVSAGTPSFSASGLANTVPAGDDGFWFDVDADLDDVFDFYVYWHAMRSGRCNDGSTTPGCAGDQGTSYHYGNVFRPGGQQPFTRDAWFCVEIAAEANRVGQSDGSLSLWINDVAVGSYGPGYPEGTWLRETFHEGGCEFSACTPPSPFEGFDFRTSSDVRFKEIILDAYYERDSSATKRAELEGRGQQVSDEQTILYDDVVVATERIGCRK
jgi:hypothetical protein